MRRLIIILFLLIASVWLGLSILKDPGYLFLTYGQWTVEVPLWFAVSTLLLSFVIFYFFITGFSWLHLAWFRFKNWLKARSEHRAYSKTQHGLALLIEGQYKKAEQLLLANVNQAHTPLVNYLGAAKAAHVLKADDRRDQYFKKALVVAPDAEPAIRIMQASCALDHHQLNIAENILRELQSDGNYPEAVLLLERLYTCTAKWRALLLLLPKLKKVKQLTADETAQYEIKIYAEMLHAANDQNLEQVQTLWDSMPRYVKKHPVVILAYAKQLACFQNEGALKLATLTQQTFKSQWVPELMPLYQDLPFEDLDKQLVLGGAWLKEYGEQPALLLFLGIVCTKIQLWGRAKDYFEKTLAKGESAYASYLYGKLLEKLGEKDQALNVYRMGLNGCSSHRG